MAGQDTFQRSTLATNNGVYYMDTTIGADAQVKAQPARNLLNVFMPDNVYYSFVLYAKPTTKQTYQIYVGKTPDGATVEKTVIQLTLKDRDGKPVGDPIVSTVEGLEALTLLFPGLVPPGKAGISLDPKMLVRNKTRVFGARSVHFG